MRVIRDIGFNNTFCCTSTMTWSCQEQLFFIDCHGNKVESPTDEEVREFIEYQRSHVETAELFLINNKNPKTHEWST
jgi:hypothetical protein